MKRRFKISTALALALFLLIGTLGCGDNDAGGEGDGSDAKLVADGRVVGSVVLSIDWPTFIDPGVGSKGSDSVALLNLYDTLTYPNDDGTIRPHVAERWDVSEDGKAYTFYLRDDVKFHSGNPLTASDVKFSMDRLLDIGEGFAYLFDGIVESTTVIDDHTIEFALTMPSGTFPAMLIRGYILEEAAVRPNFKAAGSYGENGDYGKEWLQTNDAGSGPYKVREMKTEEYLIMDRFEEYWDGIEPNSPTEVKLIGGLEATAIRTMVSRGELDITDDSQTPEALAAMGQLENVDLHSVLTGVNANLMLNTKLAPTDDVHVRRALAYATDYDTIVDVIFEGSIKPTGPVVAGMAGALNASEFPYEYNLEKAEAELKKSPYYEDLVNGDMVFKFTWCTEGGQQQEKMALLLQSDYAKLGINVELTGKPFATMMTDAQTPETTPNASIVAFAPAFADAGSVLRTRYHSNSTGSWEQMEWLQDAEIDAMIDDALITVDQDVRVQKYKEISKKIVDLSPTVFLFDAATNTAYRSNYLLKWLSFDKQMAGEIVLFPMGYGYAFRYFELAQE